MNCKTCGKEYSPTCDYQQGRCPNHPAMITKFPRWLLLLAAPFIIIPWVLTHPKEVWEQAKKDWHL